ncbi:MAG TPA: EthD domain-containing protein [Dehalococcoidia bacterium]|nr:EthD domain-containing protein [Dehalococcoidia bacterium]
MVKLIYCISKKPELSVEEFQRYWREIHAPIAGRIPGLRRYVQCHVLPELYDRRAPAFDGAAELWFDDLDAMRAAMASPEVQAALEDEKNFIDHARVASFVTVEHPIVES